ncbi:vascular endothelial growth factor receptor 1 [Frankliniella occidentalis]|uniref:receptor protein-tyrosine kinase n=1 Tax=Frankliniella occidentalis TaxID=133901 RepID=A0A9C6U9P6_FRAOC|nr:vascular endothelial growth factor receptor 1 [Frankliniella occidentalis]
MYLQTGYYRCVDNDTDTTHSSNLEDRSHVASIYVYVRDDNELLVNDDLVIVQPSSEGELVIPCRPTAPNITVTLMKDSEEIYSTNGSLVRFDPHRGFIIQEKNLSDTLYTCAAGTKTLDFFVKVMRVSDDVHAPHIHSLPYHAILGSTLELNCSVPYTGIPVDLEWAVPDQQGKETGRIVESGLREVTDPALDGRQAIKTLTVQRVQSSDEGYYKCTSKDHVNMKMEEKFIRVLGPHDSYINLTVQHGKTNISIKAGSHSTVQWIVYYSGHPQPQLIWYEDVGPEDREIVSDSKFDVYREPDITKLVIKSPSIEDTGVYKLKAVNEGSSKSVDLFLDVTGGPTDFNISVEPFYIVNEIAKIECSVLGNPPPYFKWSFRPCNFQVLEHCEESEELNTSEDVVIGKVQVHSKLTINATRSGIIQAEACDYFNNCQAKEVKLYVTDVPQGFYLYGNNLTVQGENLDFNCSVSKHLYPDDIVWKFNDYPLLENSNVRLSTTSTKLSKHSRLQISNVTKANQGLYTCVAQPIQADLIHEKSIMLNVSGMIAPVFNRTNLKGDVQELTEGQNKALYCYAVGLPPPQITWLKGKNPVTPKDNIEILENGLVLEFKYVTKEDDGEYTCVATNRAGTAKRTITFSLLDKPKGVNVGLVVGLLGLAILLLAIIIYLFVRVQREQKLRQQLTQAGLMHFEEGAIENLNMDLGVEDQAELLPYDRKFEFPREKLKLGKTLGSGAFGVVVKAEAFGINEGEHVTPVAVKMVKKTADSAIIKALASELKIMVHLGRHLNVVNLLGACTKGLNKMELLVIVEYCRYGNLHNYLMKHRNKFIDQIDPETGLIDSSRGIESLANFPNGRNRLNYAALSFSNSQSDSFKGDFRPSESRADYRSQSDTSENFATGATEATFVCMTPTGGEEGFLMSNNSHQPDWRSNYKGDYKGNVNPISTRDLLCYAFQVARGMEYLASRKVLHGDLAARNILLADNNIIKICDFGLAKSVYKDENYLKKENGPLPIKWMAIESIRDRIFSTQSDVWSFGIVLWEFFTLARTPYTGMAADEHMYKRLEEGYRMEKPPYATDDLYTVMMECWQARPILRPSFTELVDTLGSMLEDGVRKHYVDLNEPYIQMNNQWQNESGHNDYLGMFSSPNYSNVVAPPEEEEEPQRYQNIPRGAPSVVADSNTPGYLTMKSPSPTELNTIFSPTRLGNNGGNVFKFQTPPQARRQLRDTEANDHVELRPMLSEGSRRSDSTSGHESDSDAMSQYTAVPSSRPVIPNASDSRVSPLKPTNQGNLPGFSNPTYSFAPDLVVTSQDNYVNYPKQRDVCYPKPLELIFHMPPPTFSTFGRRPAQDMKLPANYANVPAQRAPLALSEADFNDHPYVN